MHPWRLGLLATWTTCCLGALLTEYPPTVQFDTDTGDIVARKFVDVTCSYTDWQSDAPALSFTVTNTDAANPKTYEIAVKCLPPTYVYELSVKGYIPRDGRLAIVDFCRMQSSDINTTYTDVVNRASLPTNVGRRLLGLGIDGIGRVGNDIIGAVACDSSGMFGGLGLMTAINAKKGGTPNRVKGAQGLATAAAVLGVVNFAASASGLCGGSGVDPATLHRLDELGDKLSALGDKVDSENRKLWDNVTATFHILDNFMSTQDLINKNITDQLTASYQTQVLAQGQTNTVYQYAQSVAKQSAQDIASVRNYVNDAFSAIDRVNEAIAAFPGTVEAQVTTAFNEAKSSINALSVSLGNLSDVVERNRISDYTELIKLAGRVRALSGITMRGLARSQDRRVFTRSALRDVARMQDLGYVPFLEDLGSNPTVDPNDFNLMVETIWIRTLASGKAYEEEYVVYCSGIFVADGLGAWMTPEDTITAIGPVNCSTVDSTENPCHCFILHTSRQCTAVAALTDSPSDPNYFTNLTGVWRTNNRLNESAHCASGVSESSVDVIKSGDDLVASLAAISAYDTDLGDSTYVISAGYAALQTALPYQDDLVNLTTMRLFRDKSSRTIARTFGQLVAVTSGSMASLGDAVTRALDGLIPNGISIYDAPFTTKNGVPAQCTQSMFMSYSPEWIPMYQMLIKDVRLNMVATMTDVDTLEETTIPITEITYTNSMQMQLPGGVLVAGSPFPDANGYVYDVEQRAMSTSPDVGARAGTVSYALCDDQNGCTATQFRNSSGQMFDARSGSNVASLYARKLVRSSSGIYRCDPSVVNASGPSSLCDIRDRYDVFPGDPLNTTVHVQPIKSGSYVARFSVPMGSVQQLIVSTCPTATVEHVTSDGTTLKLVNARPRTVILDLEYDSLTCCASRSTESVSVPAGGSVSIWVPSCTGTGGCRAQAVTASISGGGALCSNIDALDITPIQRSEAINTRGVPDLLHVQRTSSVATDQVLVALSGVVTTMTAAMTQLVIELNAASRQAGIIDTVDHNYTAGTASILSILGGLLPNVPLVRNNISTANISQAYDALTADATAKLELDNVQINSLLNESLARLDSLKTLNTLQEENIARYEDAVNATELAKESYLQAQHEYHQLTNQMFSTITDAIKQLSQNREFSLDFGNAILDLLKEVPNAAEWIVSKGIDAAESVMDKALGGLKDLFGSLQNILITIFTLVGILFAGAIAAYCVYRRVQKRMNGGGQETVYRSVPASESGGSSMVKRRGKSSVLDRPTM